MDTGQGREPPDLELGEHRLALPRAGMGPAMVDYLRRNWARFAPSMPAPGPDTFSADLWERRIAAAAEELRAGTAVRLVLTRRGDAGGEVLGDLAFTQIAGHPFWACYLGYRIDAALEGRGIMSAAVAAGVQHMFSRWNLHRIMANHVPANARSAALLRRLGFEVEGRARAYLLLAGRWEDHVLTALVNPAWTPPPP